MVLICISTLSFAADNSVNVYTWSGYIPNEVIQKFTKETGIQVNISEYDSNETMYAKLKASSAGYDVIIPSSYFVERMMRQNMLHKLDKSQIPNFKNLKHTLLNEPYDPNNDYSIPYLWGTTGIVVNSKYFKKGEITSWKDLWNPKYKNQLMMLNDVRDVFAMALLALGYSVNDSDPKHIERAYLKLKELLPNIKIFNSDAEQTIYIDEDAILGMGYNGDIHLTQKENPDVQFIYPKEGFTIWIDCLAVVKNAPHLANTYKFINFLLRPDVAKITSEETGYATPNEAAIKLMPKEYRGDKTINPDALTLKRGRIQSDTTDVLPIYAKYWELLKIGE
jgi:spermidine/putrescine transport system substrate-binding protein